MFLRLVESRGPDASPRETRNTPLTRRELPFLPGARPKKAIPHSPPNLSSSTCCGVRPARFFKSQAFAPRFSVSVCALQGWAKGPARRPGGSPSRKNTATSHSATFVLGASPHAPLMRRPRRGRRPKGRTSTAQGSTTSTAPIQAPRSAQRGSKTVAASSITPCPPHCGSACAPPVPLGTQKMGLSTPKRRPRQFCRIGRVPTGRICPLKRAGDGFLVQNPVFSHVVLRSRAYAIHLYSAHRRNS